MFRLVVFSCLDLDMIVPVLVNEDKLFYKFYMMLLG